MCHLSFSHAATHAVYPERRTVASAHLLPTWVVRGRTSNLPSFIRTCCWCSLSHFFTILFQMCDLLLFRLLSFHIVIHIIFCIAIILYSITSNYSLILSSVHFFMQCFHTTGKTWVWNSPPPFSWAINTLDMSEMPTAFVVQSLIS